MFSFKEFQQHLAVRLSQAYKKQLSDSSLDRGRQCQAIWSKLLSRHHIFGITEIIVFYRQKHKGNEEELSRVFQILLSGRVRAFNILIKNYSDPVLLDRALQSEDPVEYLVKNIRKMNEVTDVPGSYERYQKQLYQQLESVRMFDIERQEKRAITASRPFDIRLKRLDVIAAFVRPSRLSVCTAVSCFSSGWAIAANMEVLEHEALIKDTLIQRFQKLAAWCAQAEELIGVDPSSMSRSERIAFILKHIITPDEFKASADAHGLNIELPPNFYVTHQPHEAAVYYRTALAKVVNSLCFEAKVFSKREKQLLLSGQVKILLPTNAGHLVLDSNVEKIISKLNISNIHAEQLLFLHGERQSIKPFDKRVGLSKLCCRCMIVAQKLRYIVSGVSNGEYPGVVNLLDGSQTFPQKFAEVITDIPAMRDETSSDTDEEIHQCMAASGFLKYPYFYLPVRTRSTVEKNAEPDACAHP